MASSSELGLPQIKKGEAVDGEQKQKVVEAGGNNRRALEDIGNVVTKRGLEGKTQQSSPQFHPPLTRSFHPQLLASTQGGGENINKKKHVTFVVDESVVGKTAIKKVDAVKPKPEELIEISPDPTVKLRKDKAEPIEISSNTTVELWKDKAETIEISSDTVKEINVDKVATRRALPQGLSKKRVQAFTAVLYARSKAASGVMDKMKHQIVDIDAADADNQLAGVEYVDDLYKFYKIIECSSQVHDYLGSQPDLNKEMRAILVDWLIDANMNFQLRPESLYLTINIVDRYLSMKIIRKEELQLVGISAMLIASKYEEVWAPEVNDLICISNKAYSRDQILQMEKSILNKLEWNLTIATPYVFLLRFIKAAGSDPELENMVFFLVELALMQYVTTMYCPSMVAASAVYVAKCTLTRSPHWTETLKLHTGFSQPQLVDCSKLLVKLHLEAVEGKQQVIYLKYSSPHRNAVALMPPAMILLD